MNDVACAVADFLAHKRALGRKYETEEAALRLLVSYTAAQGVTDLGQITPSLLEQFLASRPRTRSRSFNHLAGVVDRFLDWSLTQQRLAVALPHTSRRRVTDQRLAFLFTPAQVRVVLGAAAELPDNARAADRGPTYRTIFALSYGLGLRAAETCGLRLGDIDSGRRLLVVRGGKFGKSRLVPHGPRIGDLLAHQIGRRFPHGGTDPGAPLFTFDGRRAVHPGTASQVFHRLVTDLGLPVPDGVCPPHLHSLRHSFAVACLLRWYREGLDPAARLHQLSTFMGHVDPDSTAVYLTMTPELLAEASQRFERFAAPAWTQVRP